MSWVERAFLTQENRGDRRKNSKVSSQESLIGHSVRGLNGTPSSTSRALPITPHPPHTHPTHIHSTLHRLPPPLQHTAEMLMPHGTTPYPPTHTHTSALHAPALSGQSSFSSRCQPRPLSSSLSSCHRPGSIPHTDGTSQYAHSCAHRHRHLPAAACSLTKLSRPIGLCPVLRNGSCHLQLQPQQEPCGNIDIPPSLPFSLAYWPHSKKSPSFLECRTMSSLGSWTIPDLRTRLTSLPLVGMPVPPHCPSLQQPEVLETLSSTVLLLPSPEALNP